MFSRYMFHKHYFRSVETVRCGRVVISDWTDCCDKTSVGTREQVPLSLAYDGPWAEGRREETQLTQH